MAASSEGRRAVEILCWRGFACVGVLREDNGDSDDDVVDITRIAYNGNRYPTCFREPVIVMDPTTILSTMAILVLVYGTSSTV